MNNEVQNGMIVDACYEVYFQLKFNFNLVEFPVIKQYNAIYKNIV